MKTAILSLSLLSGYKDSLARAKRLNELYFPLWKENRNKEIQENIKNELEARAKIRQERARKLEEEKSAAIQRKIEEENFLRQKKEQEEKIARQKASNKTLAENLKKEGDPWPKVESMAVAIEVSPPDYRNHEIFLLKNLNEAKGKTVYFGTVSAFQPIANGICMFKTTYCEIPIIGQIGANVNPKFQDYAFREGAYYEIIGICHGVQYYETILKKQTQGLFVTIKFLE